MRDFVFPLVIVLMIIWIIYKTVVTSTNDKLNILDARMMEILLHIDLIEQQLQHLIMKETSKDERD